MTGTHSYVVPLEDIKPSLIELAKKRGATVPADPSRIYIGYELPAAGTYIGFYPAGIKLFWYDQQVAQAVTT